MRHCRGVCPWEALAIAGSMAALLWVTMFYLQYADSFHILDLEPHKITCDTSRPCVRKCCPSGEELQQPNPNLTSGCYPANVTHYSLSDVLQANNGSVWDNDGFDVVYGNCVKYNPEKYGDSVLLLEDGSVKINGEELYTVSDYCIDFLKDNTYIFICSPEEEEPIDETFIFGYVFSACSLFLTTVVYLIISATPSVRERLQINSTHLTVLLNYLPSLFFAYVLLTIVYKNPCNLNMDYPPACRAIVEVALPPLSFLYSHLKKYKRASEIELKRKN